MPIREENKKRYPPEWPEISARIRFERAGNRCEGSPGFYPDCRAENGKPHPVTGSKVVLTVAHLNHTPEDCRDENLMAMCQRCHLTYDAKHKAEQRRARAATNISDDDKVVRVKGLTEEMAAYDRLPEKVRRGLASADKQYSAIQVEKMMKGVKRAKSV
jgi:hypothetical protein